MLNYALRRLLLIIPTLFGILLINFIIVQFAPGGPIETLLVRLSGFDSSHIGRISGSADNTGFQNVDQDSGLTTKYRGAQGLDPEFIKELEQQFGFDKPAYVRFFLMVKSYLSFDLGTSYFKDRPVIDLILEKLPVSISLGLWSTLIIYLVSIPLGIAKARRVDSSFDIWTSFVIIIGYAIPSFLLAVFLIVFFAGGSFFQWFPLRGLVSDHFHELSIGGKIIDYLWHITLPVFSQVIVGFASLTILTKNSFLEELGKQYVLTARAKGLSEKKVLYKHVFRNAILVIVAGFPSAFMSMFFTGSVLIEVIFSLDGLGLLSFEAIMNRDYPVVFGTLYLFTLLGLLLHLVGDLLYMVVDPRINFDKMRE